MADELSSPRWDVPFPYGFDGAVDSMGSVAAPLFAGFSVTAALIVLQVPPGIVRWPDATLSLLVAASVALGVCVQFSFRARLYVVKPSDLEAWWPAADEFQRDRMRREQRHHRIEFRRWASRARWAYNAGVLLALLGVGAALVPPDPVAGSRFVPIIISAAAVAAELTWIIDSAVRRRAIVLPDVP